VVASARFQRRWWATGIAALLWLGAPPSATALSPGTELLVPAAARTGPWTTDLYLLNLSDDTTEVVVEWLVRGQPNPDPATLELSLPGNQSLVLEDVIRSGFGLDRGRGAFRISSSAEIVATCRIYANEGDGTYGQGFEAIPAEAATAAGASTHVLGLSSTEDFRANLYAVAGADGAAVRLALVDPAGTQLAEAELELGTHEPYLEPLTTVFPIEDVDQATLLVDVVAGTVVLGASKVDNATSDPTTLASWIPGAGGPLVSGSYFGVVAEPESAASGGLTVRVDGSGDVVGIEFSYPAGACPALVTAGQDLSPAPLPQAELAAGHHFVSFYPGGGRMEWSLRLEAAGPTLAGWLAAVGSGWTGELASCNGDLGEFPVALGWRKSGPGE
jgi:hypothetical protein